MSQYSPIIDAHKDQRLRDALLALSRAGFRAALPSPWQLKVGAFNYFWTTQKITIDSGSKIKDKGIAAFIELLKAPKAETPESKQEAAFVSVSISPPLDNASIENPDGYDVNALDPPF